MIKKKITVLLSLLVLPNTCSIISCGKTTINKKIPFNPDGTEETKPKNAINALKNDEEIKEINAQISKIKDILREGIDGSKDFTPSQSLADISVQKRIAEKVKKLCNNPENIKFMPQLKSKYFKAGSGNYVDVEIIYTKKDFQITSMYHDLQIKNIKQNLEELVKKSLEDLKDPVDFKESFLIENDDFQYENIENEFINVLKNRLEQDDERLLIKLFNKSQDLLNNRTIDIEVIGKDDNYEIKRTTQITPINLLTVQKYITLLKRGISITRADKLFAYDAFYNPGYIKIEIKNKIKAKFDKENVDQLKRRDINLFEIASTNVNVIFTKGKNNLLISIKLEYNKQLVNIVLTLLDVENHPEFILNQVANHFETNGLDLSNQPIFEDSDFEAEDVKRKILEIMRKIKDTYDEKDDIEIRKIEYSGFWSMKEYYITFSHKTPNIIKLWKGYYIKTKIVKLNNIQKSPMQELQYFINKLRYSISKSIPINFNQFKGLFTYNSDVLLNLKEDNAHLNSYLEHSVRSIALSGDTSLNVQINPVKITSKDFNSIEVDYEFKFKKSGVSASVQRNINFCV